MMVGVEVLFNEKRNCDTVADGADIIHELLTN